MTHTDTSTARLMKTGLAENLAKHVAGKGISSAVQLAKMTMAELQELFNDANLGNDTIYNIRKRAAVMKALIDNHLTTVRGQVSPSYKALASTNPNNNIINFHEGMESYPEMFGNLDYATDPEFDSMISPAAYLVDLMRYIDEYIVQPLNEEDKALLLQSRRPDIWNIPLDRENTVQEIPYLQLVNEILQTKLDAEGKIEPDGSINEQDKIGHAPQYMAETIFPFNLPFNAPVEKIRKYLEALQTELYDIYTTFNIDPAAQTREYLKLTPEQTTYLTTPLANKDSLNLAYGNIETSNPRPHFTGIEDDANLGSLTNAEVFMNQVGFTQTSQLEALFYQNINRELPGSNELLNNLFINKSSNQQHLIYSPAETMGPGWTDESVWEDVSYYSTIQRVVVEDELYILVRTKKGIDTWQFSSSHRNWMLLTTATPAWSDDAGWDQEAYYSTIQAIAATNDNPIDDQKKLYLFGRFTDGLQTWVFDTVAHTWIAIINSPQLSDANGWNAPGSYRTIKTVAVGANIFLIGRLSDGIHTWCLDTKQDAWSAINPENGVIPDFTDWNGWNNPVYYLSIQVTAYQEQLFLTGRGLQGVETYSLYFMGGLAPQWFSAPLDYPKWDMTTQWNNPAYYSTIQTVKANGNLFLLGSGPDGIELYILGITEHIFFEWVYLPVSDVPNWSVADWQDPSHYLTIKAMALGKNIGLVGRGLTGIQTWELDLTGLKWSQLETSSPAWSDTASWNDPSYYTTIRTAHIDNSTILMGCTKTAIDVWRHDPLKQIWVKDELIKAVIQLQNNLQYAGLNMAVLDRLNRFIRLSGILGWTYEDLDWALIATGADDITMGSITAIKNQQWIMDTLNLTAWQASSLWHDIKTYGEGSGPVSQAPFDIVFNQPMPFVKAYLYHPLYQPNPNYQDERMVWQTDGKSAGSHAIVIRLMAALNLDARNVKALADYFKGSALYLNANEIELGVENLSVLYRYALLANSLKLSIPEFVILLEFLDLKDLLSFSSDDVIRIITCSQWMVENKLTVYQLNYISNTISSKFIDTGFDLLKVPDLLKSLSEAAAQWYLNVKQLQFENLMTEPISRIFYNTLSYKEYIDDRGIILENDFSFIAITDCFVCEEMPFAGQDQLISVCKVGKVAGGTASQIVIPSNPNNGFPVQTARDGAVCCWFKYDSVQMGVCTLYSLHTTGPTANITQVQIVGGNLVLTTQKDLPLIICSIPAGSQWHFLVISYKEQLISLDDLPPFTNLSGLVIPPGIAGALAIGETTDSFETGVAELRLFDATVTAAAIVKELYPSANNPSDPINGNTNYWPLNEGRGYETAKDVAGDINGAYAGKNVWSIIYNTIIPEEFKYLDANGSLTPAFDPATTDPGSQPFIDLWKTIVNLRNILNKAISTQKQGALQKLADYYQVNKDLAVYADYMADKDEFPHYVQTLLAYRFSLSWLEFSLDLDRPIPFISNYLINQFDANKISITEAATIKRIPDADGNPAYKWLINGAADAVYFLDKRDGALDIYKLLPAETPAIFLASDPFAADDKYSKYHIDEQFNQGSPTLYFSDRDGQFAALLKKGNYVHVAIYELPGTTKDIVAQINTFITDLGQLLFTVKTLKLSDDEFKCIVDNSDRFFTSLPRAVRGIFSLDQIKAVLLFKQLNNTYVEEDLSFAGYFYMADDMGSLVSYIAKLTQWDAQGLRQLSQWNCGYEPFAAVNIPGNLNPSGTAVDAGGSYAIAGYPLSNSVFVYQLEGEKWEALPMILAPQHSGSFGAAVAIQHYADGDKENLRAIIADTSLNNGAGIVYIYEYNKEKKGWDQPIPLTAPDATAGAAFGSSIAINGNRIVIGAPNAGTAQSGNVYIFEYLSGQWTWQNVNFTIQSGDKWFGNSISLYDDIITIGSAGNAYIFRINNTTVVPVVPPVPCNTVKVVTNGNFVVMSAMSGANPVINYITGADAASPSKLMTLTNAGSSGVCTIAIEDDTLIVNDSTNTCFVYYIQDNILAFRSSFKLAAGPFQSLQPWPIALSDGNLVIGAADENKPLMLFYGMKHDINWFGFADDCFKLANKLGVSIGSLLGFIGLSKLEMAVRSTTDNPVLLPDDNKAIYASYENYAGKLASALAMGRSPDEWDTIYSPLRNKFLEQQRDALAGYMIFSLRNPFADITGINDLYELLLIDVGSGGCRSISKIKAALNSLQLYIERCRMQLEPYTSIRGNTGGEGDALNAAEVEWSWMSHYRIWEANREVFLFPEKYFDPTLRKDKTSVYADLQNKLSQSNLTNDNATAAFQAYFHDLEALTGLTVVSSCMGRIASFVNGRIIIKNTFFILARTKNRNEGYYYRMADAILPTDTPDTWINWTNWEKINVSIKADGAACVYASGRLYLFWLEFTRQQVTGDSQSYTAKKAFNYETKAYYSFQNANGQWANPHELPDPGSLLDFTFIASGDPAQVVLPPKPDIVVFNSFLNVADLSVSIGVTNGTITPSPVLKIPVDGILDLYARYMWTFAKDSTDLRGDLSLGTAKGVSFITGNDIFSHRNVLNLNSSYAGGLLLPPDFNAWFNDSFTLGIWVNATFLTGTGAAGYWPILWPSSLATSNQLYFQIVNGYPSFGVDNQVVVSNTQLQNNSWYFIVFRYDAKSLEQSIFINGIPDQQAFNNWDLKGNAQFLFGSYSSMFAVGNMADMFTTHAPLADTEILSIYKQYINFEISDDVENYEWELNTDFEEVQHDTRNALLPSFPPFYFEPSGYPPFGHGRNALSLNAADEHVQYVTLPAHFNTFLNHSFTIGIWIFNGLPFTGDWPILASSALTPGESFCVLIRNGKAFIDFYKSSTLGKKPIAPDSWHFLVFTYDEASQTQSIFVDGLPDTSSTGHLPYSGSSPLNLGLYNNVYNFGMMANLLLVNKALTAPEVWNIYIGTVKPNNIPAPADYTIALNAIQSANGRRIQQLSEDLFMGGADYLYGKNAVGITASDLSSAAPYGKYRWELFYHIPMLIAQLLSGNQKFEEAKRWYEYIFKPTAADKSNDRFWQLGYFRSLGKPEDIVKILTDHSQTDIDQLLIYDLDPFDPEAIAYLRPGAFEKKAVINYISNLLAWGDSLFSQYTWETITQAEMLYVLAKELLGKRPDISGTFKKRRPMTIAEIETEYQNEIPQFVIDIEDMQPAIHPQVQYTPQLSASLSNFYFGIPENDELPALQDLVDTRLFEIRNCLNILGQQQSLALFEPPVNPMMLVAAGAAGINLADVPISYATDIPYFRFAKMIAFAKEVSERVVDFGRQILGALERNDEERLAILRTVQEKTILDLTTAVKEKEIEAAMNQGLVLDQSLASANERVAYYSRMLAKPISDLEGKALGFNQIAIDVEIPATGLHVAAVVGHLIPTVFGFADGDFSPGGSIESAAAALSSGSAIANNLANMTAVSASYSRRVEDWALQLKLAQYEVASIGIQKAINDIQVQNATADLAVQNQNITNNQDLQQFYANKFTNRELYQWMIDQISSVYYQAFQMAQDLAKKAQAAYQFELNRNENIITYGYWDNTRRGLLSGEKLIADLGRLEKAYVDNNQRYLEIQKIVSLKDISLTELVKLIKTGTCRISLTEQLFDRDFPGHYNRKIKSVSITIPAIVGPYQSIKASLVQQSNKVVTQPDLNTVRYLVSKEKQPAPGNNSLRINWRPNQQIAISKASGDSGMFELNFNDERYLPFEGTGAVSDWQLNIPQATNAFDLSTISDVILYINYTAQDGGVEFAQQVSNLPEIKNYKGVLMVSIRQQFNQSWNAFMNKGSAILSVKELQFPPNLQSPENNIDGDNIAMMYRTSNGTTDLPVQLERISADSWKLDCTDPKRTELLDIILEIPYSADVK